MADLKKKFIDILFEEDDPEQEVREDSYYSNTPDIKIENIVKTNNDNESKSEPVLHRSDRSAFINLDEKNTEKHDDIDTVIKEEYEMSSQISPMFGVLKESKKREYTFDENIEKHQTKKPLDSHLDIITSPIYGYANKEDAKKDNFEVKNIIDDVDEEELHHLFDSEEEYLDKSYNEETNDDLLTDEDISLFRLFGDNK